MDRRVIAGAVLVLVVVVGAIFIVVGANNGGDAGSSGTPSGSRSVVTSGIGPAPGGR